MDTLYEDAWVRCGATSLEIRGYDFALATSKIAPYRAIQAVTPIELTPWTAGWRMCGTFNPGRWWHLDWSRPRKQVALVVGFGRPVHPVISPADPERVAAIIERRRRIQA